MSISSGSIATIIPMLAIVVVYPIYYKKSRKIFFIYTALLTFIGIVSKKGAILFYIPLLVLVLYFINLVKVKRKILDYGKIVRGLFVALLLGYLIIRLVPRFNPEYEVWGSFDTDFVVNFISDYVTRTNYNSNDQVTGRLSAIPIIWGYLDNIAPIKFFIGLGPGDILKTGLVGGQENVLQHEYQFGYGSRIGVWWFVFQIGLFGFFAYFIYHVKIIKYIFNNYPNYRLNSEAIHLKYSIVVTIGIILLDIITYSTVSIENYTTFVLAYSYLGFGINKLNYIVKKELKLNSSGNS